MPLQHACEDQLQRQQLSTMLMDIISF